MTWNVEPSAEEVALLLEAGVIYRDAGKMQEAREVFRGVRALHPASEVPEIFLGTVCFGEGRFDDAAAHYQRAIRLNQRSAWAHAQLGEAQLFRGDVDAAKATIQHVLDLEPRGESSGFAKSLLVFIEQLDNAGAQKERSL